MEFTCKCLTGRLFSLHAGAHMLEKGNVCSGSLHSQLLYIGSFHCDTRSKFQFIPSTYLPVFSYCCHFSALLHDEIPVSGKVPFLRIPLPLLDLETKHAPSDSAQPLPELPLQDQPLQFSQKAVSDVCSSKNTLQHKNLRPRSPNPLGLEYSSSSSASEDD